MITEILDYTKVPDHPQPVPQIPVYMIGCGFISSQGHGPGAALTGFFELVGAAPSRDSKRAEQFRMKMRLKDHSVTTDYKIHLPKYIAQYSDQLVVIITTDTPGHKEAILWCAGNGVKIIVVDKPVVCDLGELDEVLAAVRAQGVLAIVTFNHEYGPGMVQLQLQTQEEIRRSGPKSVSVRSGFLQSWVKDGVDNWRLTKGGKAEGILDLKTHSASAASFVLCSPIASVTRAELGTSSDIHSFNIWDHGDADLTFANGSSGQVRFHQCLPGYQDHYYCRVDFRDQGRSVMFGLDWHSEGLFYGPLDARTLNRSDWSDPVLRGSDMFDAGINANFGLITPSGHMHGWVNFWQVLYYCISRAIWERQNHWVLPAVPDLMKYPVPTVLGAGVNAQLLAEAVQLSFASRNPVNIRELAARHQNVSLAYEESLAV